MGNAKQNKKKNKQKHKQNPQSRSAGLVPGTILEVEISGLGYGGYGVAKGSFGVVFVHRGVPGDKVRIRITRGKKKYGSGEIEAIIKPSDKRIDPECSAFKAGCGGCQWLHMKYQLQTEWKQKIVCDTLKRIGGVSCKVEPVIPLKPPLHYRNKLSLQVRAQAKVCGFMKENSHSILEMESCRCAVQTGFSIYDYLNKIVKEGDFPDSLIQIHVRSARDGSFGVCLYANELAKEKKQEEKIRSFADKILRENSTCSGIGLSLPGSYRNLCGQAHIEEKMGKIKHLIPHNGFFQTNYSQAEELLRLVGPFLDPAKADTLLDVFCGSGLFALDLAGSCSQVLGIENNMSSITYADINADLNTIKNCKFERSDAVQALQRIGAGKWNIAVLDPPRSGCGAELVDELCRIAPLKIAYVSCAPDTLARDLKIFTSQGYKVEFCQPVDMFPHTWHVEVVVGLKRT